MLKPTLAWVFVSHASANLPTVRKVRNFIEDKGGGPILFHLRSLTSAEEFWPLIEREIGARNFFLLCDSEAARTSAWVQRERSAVDAISRKRPIRIGRISLDEEEIDFAVIDRFMNHVRVYVTHPSAFDTTPVSQILEYFGYGIIGSVGFSSNGLRYLAEGGPANDDLFAMMTHGASQGWLMVLLDKELTTSPELFQALSSVSAGRVIFIATEPDINIARFREMHGTVLVEWHASLHDTLHIAVRKMLLSQRD